MSALPIAEQHDYADLCVGDALEARYVHSDAVRDAFLSAFGDYSPVHIDDALARARGFDGPVMHGAILNGFLSHFVGMRLPGHNALLLSVDLRYAAPSYRGDEIALRGRIEQKIESRRVIVLRVEFHNLTRDTLIARGRVQVGLQP